MLFVSLPILNVFRSYLVALLTTSLLSNQALLIVSALLVNIVAFAMASEVLFALSNFVLRRRDLSWISVCWFSITPAGIFMTAAYTERQVQKINKGAPSNLNTCFVPSCLITAHSCIFFFHFPLS